MIEQYEYMCVFLVKNKSKHIVTTALFNTNVNPSCIRFSFTLSVDRH